MKVRIALVTVEVLATFSLNLVDVSPLDDDVTSVWVDGGSMYEDMIGGSMYVVRAAAGYFKPDSPITWHIKMNSGFIFYRTCTPKE